MLNPSGHNAPSRSTLSLIAPSARPPDSKSHFPIRKQDFNFFQEGEELRTPRQARDSSLNFSVLSLHVKVTHARCPRKRWFLSEGRNLGEALGLSGRASALTSQIRSDVFRALCGSALAAAASTFPLHKWIIDTRFYTSFTIMLCRILPPTRSRSGSAGMKGIRQPLFPAVASKCECDETSVNKSERLRHESARLSFLPASLFSLPRLGRISRSVWLSGGARRRCGLARQSALISKERSHLHLPLLSFSST